MEDLILLGVLTILNIVIAYKNYQYKNKRTMWFNIIASILSILILIKLCI